MRNSWYCETRKLFLHFDFVIEYFRGDVYELQSVSLKVIICHKHAFFHLEESETWNVLFCKTIAWKTVQDSLLDEGIFLVLMKQAFVRLFRHENTLANFILVHQ